MFSHYTSAPAFPTYMSMALESAFLHAEEMDDQFFDDTAPSQRPAVPGESEQVLDTDYDPDPAQEATPLKNAPAKKTMVVRKKPAPKR